MGVWGGGERRREEALDEGLKRGWKFGSEQQGVEAESEEKDVVSAVNQYIDYVWLGMI